VCIKSVIWNKSILWCTVRETSNDCIMLLFSLIIVPTYFGHSSRPSPRACKFIAVCGLCVTLRGRDSTHQSGNLSHVRKVTEYLYRPSNRVLQILKSGNFALFKYKILFFSAYPDLLPAGSALVPLRNIQKYFHTAQDTMKITAWISVARSVTFKIFTLAFTLISIPYTVIPRLTKIIRSGITFVSQNFSLSRT